jgi:dTDP-4-dehydrorhamnose reductase
MRLRQAFIKSSRNAGVIAVSRCIAVLGAGGQLGRELMPRLGIRAAPLTHAEVDVTDAAGLQTRLDEIAPDLVVNCAAYNLVDRAEDEPEAAFAVNAFGVRNLAKWCGARDVPLMHISTDYVFGAHSAGLAPWCEKDMPAPLGVYGASKLAGEWFVQSHCPRHWIVRTCGLYGRGSTRAKGNFVETMLRLGAERPEVRVVADQRCTPTSTADLAPVLMKLLDTTAYGLYHATNTGGCTWYEFACEIFRMAGLSPQVTPITTAEYGAKARRPPDSVLDTSKLATLLGSPLRPWQDALRNYLASRERQ